MKDNKKNNERRNILRIKREKRLFERIQNKISIKVKSAIKIKNKIKIKKSKDKIIIISKVAPRKVEARKVAVKKLQDLGFEITGDSVEDQFCHGV